MNRKEVEIKVEQILEPIAAAHGVRIYDVDYTKNGEEHSLCAYIDKDGGVTIDDCVDVSHDLSDALDREDPIPEAYTLYVSSPGLGRTLTKDRHFTACIGEEVEGTTFQPFLYPEEAADTIGNKPESFDENRNGGLSADSDRENGSKKLSPDFINGSVNDQGNSRNCGGKKNGKKSSKKKKQPHREFDGVLKDFDANTGTVTVGRTTAKGKELPDLVLNRKDIAKIRLKIDF